MCSGGSPERNLLFAGGVIGGTGTGERGGLFAPERGGEGECLEIRGTAAALKFAIPAAHTILTEIVFSQTHTNSCESPPKTVHEARILHDYNFPSLIPCYRDRADLYAGDACFGQ